nr:hypothetical protein CFP56_52917 [Quercus suber]
MRILTLLNSPHPLVEVYSLAKNEWIMLRKPCPMCCTLRDLEPLAFVNGAVHWVVFRSTNSSVYRNSIAFVSLCLPKRPFPYLGDEEYGVELSWKKVISFRKTNAIETIPRPIGFRRNHEIVFEMNGREMDGGHLVLQNLETQEIKDLGIVGYNQWCSCILRKIRSGPRIRRLWIATVDLCHLKGKQLSFHLEKQRWQSRERGS